MLEVLFQIGRFSIPTFNVLVAVAFLVSMAFLLRFVERKKLPASFLSGNFFLMILCAILGGRILEIAENSALYLKNPLQTLFLWDMEYSALGLFYGLAAALIFAARKNQENLWAWMDAFTLSGLLGMVFLHLGHFFRGSHYGTPTDLPWGMTFDTFSIPFVTPIHPTQLYAALITFALFAFLMHRSRRTHLPGMVGNLGIMLYSLSAFGLNFIQGVPSVYAKANFLAIAAVAFVLLVYCSHQTYYQYNEKTP